MKGDFSLESKNQKLQFPIKGMTCVNCQNKIEKNCIVPRKFNSQVKKEAEANLS